MTEWGKSKLTVFQTEKSRKKEKMWPFPKNSRQLKGSALAPLQSFLLQQRR